MQVPKSQLCLSTVATLDPPDLFAQKFRWSEIFVHAAQKALPVDLSRAKYGSATEGRALLLAVAFPKVKFLTFLQGEKSTATLIRVGYHKKGC